jgi:hypothetical protein
MAERLVAVLSHDAFVERRNAGGRHVRPLEFRDEASVSHNANAMAQIRLKIQVRRGSNKRHDLTTFIDKCELGSTGPPGDDRSQDAHSIVRSAVGRGRGRRAGIGWCCTRCTSRTTWLNRLRNARRHLVMTPTDFRKSVDLILRNSHGIALGLRFCSGHQLSGVALQPLGIPKICWCRSHPRQTKLYRGQLLRQLLGRCLIAHRWNCCRLPRSCWGRHRCVRWLW